MESAYSFFDEESEEMKNELKVASTLVDIACQFIRYRGIHNLTQKELANKLQIAEEKVAELESGDYDPTISELHSLTQKLAINFNITLVSKYSAEK